MACIFHARILLHWNTGHGKLCGDVVGTAFYALNSDGLRVFGTVYVPLIHSLINAFVLN